MASVPSTFEMVQRVLFHYIKSRLFRVIHVDGAIGGITPAGYIHMTIFSERPAIPQTSEHPVTSEGTLGAPALTSKEGFVREMDADLMMSRSTAEGIRDWLNERLSELDQREAGQGGVKQ
jgi:hypothetical protein